MLSRLMIPLADGHVSAGESFIVKIVAKCGFWHVHGAGDGLTIVI